MPNENNRLTVVERIYHQITGQNPTIISGGFTRKPIADVDQVWSRTPPKGIGPNWEPLDLGWITSCILLHVHNLSAESTIEVTFSCVVDDPCIEDPSRYCLVVPPNETLRITPSSARDLRMRSQSGQAQYTITAIPG